MPPSQRCSSERRQSRACNFLLIIAWLVLVMAAASLGSDAIGTTLAIIYESSDTTPELANLLVMLRNGAAAETLKTRKCELVAVDKDVTDHTNKPLKLSSWLVK